MLHDAGLRKLMNDSIVATICSLKAIKNNLFKPTLPTYKLA